MDPRNSKGSRGDVPIIGDFSAAYDAELRKDAGAERRTGASAEPREDRSDAPEQPRASSGNAPARNDPLLIDPSDARRHTERLRQRERQGPVAKVAKFAPLVLLAAAAFGVYWNFETLRTVEVTFAPLRSIFAGDPPPPRPGEAPRFDEEPPSESVAAPVMINPDAPAGPADAMPVPLAGDSPADPEPAAGVEPQPEPLAATPLEPALDPPPPPAPPPPPPEPETFVFGLASHTVSEADAAAAVLILRNGGDGGESSVRWWTSAGTATPGVDYVDPGEVIERFPRGAQNRTIRIPIIGDRLPEGPETFYVHLAPSDGASVPAERLRTEVVIADDD